MHEGGVERVFRLSSAASKGNAAKGTAKGTNLQAFFTFFKSMFGAGILVISHKFTDVGLPLGLLVFVAVALFVVATTYMLLDCHRHCSAIANTELQSFEDIAGFILGKYGRRTIRYSVALLQLLFCTGFMIVFCDNMEGVFPAVNRAEYAGLALVPLTLLSWIPNMRDMWVVSALGLVVYLVGVIGLSLYDGAKNYERPDEMMEWKAGGVASFFGVCAYAIEGICLVIPTSVTLRRQEDAMGVITLSLVLYTLITLGFAAFTFSAGLGSCDSIVECLEEGFLATGVRLALCGALILTHPVFIIVVAAIVEGRLFQHEYRLVETEDPEGSKREHGHGHGGGAASNGGISSIIDLSPRSIRVKLIRFVLVGITCAIAASGIKFSVFSGLVGSVLTSFVGFVMPAVMWWQLYRVVGTAGEASRDGSRGGYSGHGQGDIISPLLPASGAQYTPASSRNRGESDPAGPKDSLFSLLSPSEQSEQGSNQAQLYKSVTPDASTNDPSRDWIYSSFIADSAAPASGSFQRTTHDVVLEPPPLLQFNSNNNLKCNSGDDSSVDSKETGSPPKCDRRKHSTSNRPSWFGRLFDSMSLSAGGPDSSRRGNTSTGGGGGARGQPPSGDKGSRNTSVSSGGFLADVLLEGTVEGSYNGSSRKTLESLYEYEEEVRVSGDTQRYRLPPLTIAGHLSALFFVVIGIVAMIAGGYSGMHELIHG
jgi:amino acid permease